MFKRKKERKRRHKKIRTEISGTAGRPRLNVYRSLNHIYGQLINDETGEVLASAKDGDLDKFKDKKDAAFKTGRLLAKKAAKKDIKRVVFDRAGYKYHGRVKALAEGAREGGLNF